MAATTGRTGIGVTLKLGDGASPEVFATVANVTALNAGGVTLGTVEATHLASPNFYEEFLPTLKSAEVWTFTLQWDPSNATHDGTTGLRAKMESRALTNVKVNPYAIGLAKGFAASGYVTQLGNVSITPTGIMTQECQFRPTGQVTEETFTAA